jgi:hypothetical protein
MTGSSEQDGTALTPLLWGLGSVHDLGPASEKLEIIYLVEQSHLPARRTMEMLGSDPAGQKPPRQAVEA